MSSQRLVLASCSVRRTSVDKQVRYPVEGIADSHEKDLGDFGRPVD